MNYDNHPKPASPQLSTQSCENECPKPDGCHKIADEYAEINVPVELRPKTELGEVTTECCGEPTVSCKCDPCNGTCNIVITQKVKIKIPIKYSVDTIVGNSVIECASNCCCED